MNQQAMPDLRQLSEMMEAELGRQFPIYFPSVRPRADAYQKDLPVIGISQKILTYIFDDQSPEPGSLMNRIRESRDRTPHHLEWNTTGIAENELVFAAGNPQRTSRRLTLAQLEFLRDVSYPLIVDGFAAARAARWRSRARLGRPRAGLARFPD